MAYEQLKYEVLKKEGHIEIRKYAPLHGIPLLASDKVYIS